MKLHSPAFERGLRRSVRAAVRRSPELRREQRRVRGRSTQLGAGVLRPLFTGGLVVLVWNCAVETGHITTGLAALALGTTWLALYRAVPLRTALFDSGDLPALFLLPIPDRSIFRWQFQKFFRSSLWSLLDNVAVLLVLGGVAGFSAGQYAALLPLAGLMWVVQLAFTVLVGARLPWLGPAVTVASVAGVLTALFLEKLAAIRLLPILDRHADTILLLMPTGWVGSGFKTIASLDWWAVLPLLPAAILIGSWRSSRASLAAGYGLREQPQPEASDRLPDDFSLEQEMWRERNEDSSEPSRTLARAGETQIRDYILSRRFLAMRAPRARQWLERWLWKWLHPRERVLADFAFPDGLEITTPWIKVFRNLALAVLLGLLVQFLSPGAARWVWLAGLVVTGIRALTLVLISGAAFQSVTCSGIAIPLHAIHGLGCRELSCLLNKCTLIQVPVALVFALAAGMNISWLFGAPMITGLLCGFKAALLLPAVRWLMLPFSFGWGLNSADVRLKPLLMLVPLAIAAFVFFLLCGLAIFNRDFRAALMTGSGALMLAYGMLRFHRWLYHRNRFDLMNVPSQSAE